MRGKTLFAYGFSAALIAGIAYSAAWALLNFPPRNWYFSIVGVLVSMPLIAVSLGSLCRRRPGLMILHRPFVLWAILVGFVLVCFMDFIRSWEKYSHQYMFTVVDGVNVENFYLVTNALTIIAVVCIWISGLSQRARVIAAITAMVYSISVQFFIFMDRYAYFYRSTYGGEVKLWYFDLLKLSGPGVTILMCVLIGLFCRAGGAKRLFRFSLAAAGLRGVLIPFLSN